MIRTSIPLCACGKQAMTNSPLCGLCWTKQHCSGLLSAAELARLEAEDALTAATDETLPFGEGVEDTAHWDDLIEAVHVTVTEDKTL